MKIIRPLLYLLLILVGAFLLFLLYATIDDYSPDEVSIQSIDNEADIIPDSLQIKLRRNLLKLEQHHNPIDIIFLYQILEWVGQLADHSEHIGTQLELILARS